MKNYAKIMIIVMQKIFYRKKQGIHIQVTHGLHAVHLMNQKTNRIIT